MKDSIGSTLLMKIFVVFMIVYIILMASILNYTKTFRIKNQIINIINRHNGYTTTAKQEISDYFSKSSLYGSCILLEGNNDFGSSSDTRCEIKEYQVTNATDGKYYKIKLYVTFQFPLTKRTLQIPITGETKTLYEVENPGKPSDDFELVDNSVSIPDAELPEDSDCTPEPKPPTGGGCCTTAICSGGTRLGGLGNGCACYDSELNVSGSKPTYNPNEPGRKAQPAEGSACCYSYTCTGKATLKSANQDSSHSADDSRTFILTIDDSDNVGMGNCTVTSGSCNGHATCTVVAPSDKSYLETATITCIDMLNNKTTKTVTVNLQKCGENEVSNSNHDCVCDDGYEWSPSQEKCVKKSSEVTCNVSNCSKCDTANHCTSCDEGYRSCSSGCCKKKSCQGSPIPYCSPCGYRCDTSTGWYECDCSQSEY